ncbi:hypothetical protein JBE04_00005 [Streptomyces sp. PRKS01-29]|nr:hypothetical protein [Streptomyces sabulosicollis]MBI0292920.1 hypothetical protein [Streptomyces sabulosicollis]
MPRPAVGETWDDMSSTAHGGRVPGAIEPLLTSARRIRRARTDLRYERAVRDHDIY